MIRSSPRSWLRLACFLHLLCNVAALDVVYPKIGTTYPALGPDDVQWTSTDITDPSDLAIYLATYKGQNLTSQRPCIVASLSDGSTAITLTHPAPEGDSWTWLFYDNDVVIAPGYNYIAESVHFQIKGSSSSSSSKGIGGLSPAVAAAAGVGGTVVLVLIGVLIVYFCFYRRRHPRITKGEITISAPYVDHGFSKHELDSKAASSSTSDFSSSASASGVRYQGSFHKPFAPPPASHHEMEALPSPNGAVGLPVSPSVASPTGELANFGRHSRLPPPPTYPTQVAAPWRELAVSPVRHEMLHDSRRVFPQELPGDSVYGNGISKEFI